jgi:hypothetical protein
LNKPENQNYIGEYPPIEEYGYKNMDPKKGAAFLKWYESVKEEQCDFKIDLSNTVKPMSIYWLKQLSVLETYLRRCWMLIHGNIYLYLACVKIFSLINSCLKIQSLAMDLTNLVV